MINSKKLIHKPIDYTKWNFDGKGNNIINLLLPVEKEIWNIALPYQDKRNDTGHAENVTYFALKLTEFLNGKREITIPAAILHDIGWSQMKKEELDQFYDTLGTDYEKQLRYRHQDEGVKFSRELLTKSGYPSEFIDPICEIISGHDTRKGFISKEDGIVRDADKLWRFTMPLFEIVIKERKWGFQKMINKCNDYISKSNFFYSEISKDIARIELDKTIESYKNKVI